MKYPKLSPEEMRKRLEPPKGKVRMVLDTDTYNEVDDQFALAYALLSKQKLSVERVYAAPFSGQFFAKLLKTDDVTVPMTFDLAEGLEQSYQEIIKIFGMLGESPEGKVFKGSDRYLSNKTEPVESPAARDLVKLANESDELLYVVAIGEITNIASAILMDPEIIKKIVVIWLGGHPLYWPHAVEFNLGQDPLASQIIFDCGVPLVLVPCMTVASNLTVTAEELRANLYGKSKIATYLTDIVTSQLNPKEAANMLDLFRLTYLKGADDCEESTVAGEVFGKMAPSRIVWDISTIGYLINPIWCPSTIVESPVLTDDLKWEKSADKNRHLMRICNFVYRDGIFGDMFEKLAHSPL